MPERKKSYLRKVLKWGGIAVAIAGISLLVAVARYAHVHFFAHREYVEARLAALPPEQAELPPVVIDVFRTVEGKMVANRAARILVKETHPDRMPIGEWHLLNALWTLLLPVMLEDREMIALEGNDMYLGRGGYGLEFGAEEYFGKTVDTLTTEEVLGLLVIARAPGNYDPGNKPDEYGRMLAHYREIYLSRAAPTGQM